MKQTSIRVRLFLPIAVLMVILPVVIYLVFSTVTAEYAMGQSRAAILSTIESVSSIVDEIYVAPQPQPENRTVDPSELLRVQAREFLYETRRQLRRSQFDSSIIVLNSLFSRQFPEESDEAIEGITQHYAAHVSLMDAPALSEGERSFERLTIGGQDYLSCMLMLRDPEEMLSNYLIVFASVSDTGLLLRTAGYLVLAMVGAMALTLLLVSWLLATSVAGPLNKEIEHMARIGSGSFDTVELKTNVREIDALIDAANAMAVRLKRADEAQKTFFENASHELRTPLMSIQGYAEGIQMDVLGDVKQAAGVIVEESRHLTKIVDSLLTLSRMDSAQHDMEIEDIDLNAFTRNTVERLSGLAMKENKQLIIAVEPARRLIVKADEQLMYKAMMNVLSNALRYAVGTVTLSIWAEGSCAVLRIADDGVGIDETVGERVFDRFYHGKDGQYGIGLSIAKSAMEYMGGSIAIAKTAGGAAFDLSFLLSDKK